LPTAVTSVRLSSVRPRAIEWLWSDWLPLGKLCELAGEVGLSKSTLLLDLAARVSSNGVMPDGSQGTSGGVCLMSAEDGLEDTILPRLQAAGADLTKIGFFEGYNRAPLLLPDHLERIEVRLRDYDARLLLIDPLAAFLARGASDREVRRALHPMKALAERLRCTVLWLRHLTGRGPRTTLGPARSGLFVGRDPEDPGRCVLAQRRNNLGERQTSLTYRLEKVVECGCCRIVWGERSALTAEELDGAGARKEPAESPQTRSKFELACAFLRAVLKNGPRTCHDVKEAAEEACISERTLERAAAALRLELIAPTGPGSSWRKDYQWALPEVGGLAEQS
jgi:hypothetical protein